MRPARVNTMVGTPNKSETFVKSFLICTLLITMSGCVYQAPRYTVMADNVSLVKGSSEKLSLNVIDPSFRDDGSIICRATTVVSLPGKSTFSQYIADALVKELSAANSFSKTSPTILQFQLIRADFSTALGNTNWYIDSKYFVGGNEFYVSTIYHDRSSYVGIKACNNIAVYFSKAVAMHIHDVFEQLIVFDAL